MGFLEDGDYDDTALEEMLRERTAEYMSITLSEKACLSVSRRRPCPSERRRPVVERTGRLVVERGPGAKH